MNSIKAFLHFYPLVSSFCSFAFFFSTLYCSSFVLSVFWLLPTFGSHQSLHLGFLLGLQETETAVLVLLS